MAGDGDLIPTTMAGDGDLIEETATNKMNSETFVEANRYMPRSFTKR